VSDALALNQLVPGLNFQANGSTAQPAIRGVSSSGSTAGDASNVAIYVDGVYQPFQARNYLDLVNIQRIEVLKGPQGTLFGRNATGGAISITTPDPQFKRSVLASVSYGRFNEISAQGHINLPLGDRAAMSVTLKREVDDGFRKDAVTGAPLAIRKVFNGRAKLRFQPSDTLNLVLSGDYLNTFDNTVFSGQPLDGNTAAATLPGAVIVTDPNSAALSFVPFVKVRGGGGSLRMELDLPFGRLKSITAYRRYTTDQRPDSDVTPVRLSESRLSPSDKTFTQEVNLASAPGRLQWLVGAFYFDDRAKLLLRAFGGIAPTYTSVAQVLLTDVETHTRSYAVYGEATFKPTDRLSLIGGLRYNRDDISYDGTNGILVVAAKADFNSVTPRASIKYDITDTANIYATYSKGFKAGVFNSSALVTAPVDPEKIDAYEIGFKGNAGRTLSFSLAAYQYDYKDLQFQSFGATSSISVLQNAADARIRGGELETNLRLFDALNVRVGVAYTHARYRDFPRAQGFVPRPTGGNLSVVIPNAGGNQMIRTPDWSGTVGADYSVAAFGGTIALTGNLYLSSRLYYDVANLVSQKPYQLLNASVTWTSSDDHFDIGIYGQNITDTVYKQSVLISALANNVNYGRPSTYGVRMGFRF
jgi:iron complex outermembrane receptor protein